MERGKRLPGLVPEIGTRWRFRPSSRPALGDAVNCRGNAGERHHGAEQTERDAFIRHRALMPPLRDRREDVPMLLAHFLVRYCEENGKPMLQFTPGALKLMMDYEWPGNVRELERMIERAVALAETEILELDDLSPSIRGDFGAVLAPSIRRGETLRTWASRYTRLVLHRTNGNKREACRLLDISYHTLQSHLRHEVVDDCEGRDEPGPDGAVDDDTLSEMAQDTDESSVEA